MDIFQKSLPCLKIPSRNHTSSSTPLLRRTSSSSSSSSPKNHYDTNNNTDTSVIVSFPPATPKKINSGKTMGRIFPQSLKKADYPQDERTGLRSYQNENNIIIHFVFHDDLMLKDTLLGSNSPKLMTLHNQDYVYKTSLMSKQSLPKNHSRTLNNEEKYFSNSRVMMQIMSRNLLELLLKNEPNVILPDIHPVVHNNTGEICGLISKKIECNDYASLQEKFKKGTISKENYDNDNQNIEEKTIKTNIAILAKIIGIDDLIYFFENPKIRNIGLTPNDKLVLFDFGLNMLDLDVGKEKRHLLFKPDDDYGCVILSSDNNPNPLLETVNTYFKNYQTLQNGFENDGTAKKVHPDIEHIIMNTGPGDTEFRTKLAKLIQARINNAILQTEKI